MHERIVGKSDIDKIFMALTLVRNSCGLEITEICIADNHHLKLTIQRWFLCTLANVPSNARHDLYLPICFCIFRVTFASKWTFSNILKEKWKWRQFRCWKWEGLSYANNSSRHLVKQSSNVSIWGKDTWNAIEQKVSTLFSLHFLCPCLDKNGKLLIYAS